MKHLIGVVVVLVSGAAHADPAPAPDEPYRAVLIAGDAVGLLFTGGGSALVYRSRNCTCEDFSGELVIFGLGAYVSIGAFVHHDAGADGRAVASVALRAGLPIMAGELTHHLGASTGPSLLAAGAGMLAAMAIDWFALADARGPAKQRDPVSLYATPTAGGMIAGLGGPLP